MPQRNLPPGYFWLVVSDPTGDFRGSLFRWMDVKAGGWLDGTTFRHVTLGIEKTYRNGILSDVGQSGSTKYQPMWGMGWQKKGVENA